jgi:hypothetical protein
VTGALAVTGVLAGTGVAATGVAVRGAPVTLVVDAATHPGADAATTAPMAIQRPTRHVRDCPAGQGMVTANAGGLHRSLNILVAFFRRGGTHALISAGAITVSRQTGYRAYDAEAADAARLRPTVASTGQQALPTIFSEVILPSFT